MMNNPPTSAVPASHNAFPEQESALMLQQTLEAAQKNIQNLVNGNGMHKSAVRISEKNVVLNPLTVSCTCRLVPIEKETQASGLKATGTELQNRHDLRPAIDLHLSSVLQNPDTIARLARFATEHYYGFGLKDAPNFPAAQKAFWFRDECHTCNGRGQSDCGLCHGKGQQPCSQCSGQGRTPCYVCKGLKQLPQSDGSFAQCHECAGFGSTPCPGCRESKTIPCKGCHATGKSSCKSCDGSGNKTVIITVDFRIDFTSRLSWPNGIPDGLKYDEKTLFLDRYAKAGKNPQKIETDGPEVRFEFSGAMPSGTIGFSLNGKRVETVVTGMKGKLATDTMFLDSLVKPGIGALNKIARGPMATGALFQRARSYRMIRDVTDHIAAQPKKKILDRIRAEYPLGLSDKYAKAMIKLADDAVSKITVRPRWIGAAIGCALFSVLIGAWFHLGLRPGMLEDGSLNLQLLTDSVLLGLSIVGTAFIIKKLTQVTMQKMLGNAPPRLPAAGDPAIAAAVLLAVVFLIAGATSPAAPEWWSRFF